MKKRKNKDIHKKNESKLGEEWVKNVKEIIGYITPGLISGNLYEKGILNIPLTLMNKIFYSPEMIVYLSFCIQAYPYDSFEATEEEQFACVKSFEAMLATASLQKKGYLIADIKAKNLNLTENIGITLNLQERIGAPELCKLELEVLNNIRGTPCK